MLELRQLYSDRTGPVYSLPLSKETLLLYPSGDSVVILESENLTLRCLLAFWNVHPGTQGSTEVVRCMAVDPGMKLVLASLGIYVAGWSLSRARGSDEWRVHSSLVLPHNITSLDTRSGLLAVGTEQELKVFTLVLENDLPTWSLKWSMNICSPIITRFSPSLMFIATSCQIDNSVHIHLTSSGRRTQLIEHSRPIIDLTWRTPEASGRDDVVLYTATTDSTLRVFLPLPDTPQRLQLHAALDIFSALPFDVAASYLARPQSSSSASKVYPVDRQLVHDALKGILKRSNLDEAVQVRLKEIQDEAWDLFIRVLSDGSVILSAIENIDRRPPTMLKQFTILHSAPLLLPSFIARSQLSLMQTSTTLSNGLLTLITTHPITSYQLDLAALLLGFSSGLQQRTMAEECSVGLKSPITRLGRTPDGRGLAVMRTDGSETWVVPEGQITALKPSGQRSNKFDLVVFENGTVYVTHTSSGQLSLHGDWSELISLSVPPLNIAFSLRRGDGLWSLIGIAEDLSIIHIYVNLRPSPSMTLHSNSSLPLSKLPMMILPVDPMAWSGAIINVSEPEAHDVLLSVSAEGDLSFWVTESRSKGPDDWICTGKVTTQRSNIRMARCSSAKKTVLVAPGPSGEELTIWDSKESEFASGLEYRSVLQLSDQVNDLDWSSTPDKQSILAVGYHHRVELLCQERMTYFDDVPGWSVCWKIDISTFMPHPIRDSIWLANGALAVAAGHAICLYTQTRPIAGDNNREGLFEYVARHNGPLEDYHPQMLLQCLLWGKVELVKGIIVHLAKAVDRYSPEIDGHSLPWERLSPEAYFRKDEMTNASPLMGKHQYDNLFRSDHINYDNTDGQFSRNFVEKLLSQLEDKPVPHMTPNELAHLTSLIETTLEIDEQRRALDANGLRYLISMRSFYILNRRMTLLGASRDSGVESIPNKNKRARLRYRDIVWAFHSESQEILLQASMAACEGKMNWSDAKALGVFMWLHSLDSLKSHMEVVARNQYMSGESRDPTACSLFYFALGKAKLVHGLWRQAAWHKEQGAMLKFLANDFTQARWRTAALKNAFALMSKQRFEYAAAFFLLGGSLKDAVNVCVRQLNDFQLAVAIARVAEQGNDGPMLKDVLSNTVIPVAFKEGNRWLASWAFWLLHRRDLAVRVLVTPLTELTSVTEVRLMDVGDPHYDDPSLALLFSQLKSKTLQTAKGTSEISGRTEFNFVLQTARVFTRMGCHMLALDLVRSWSFERPSVPQRDILAPLNGPPSPTTARFMLTPAMRRQSSVVIDMDISTAAPTRRASPAPEESNKAQLAPQETLKPESDLFARKAGLGNLMKSAKEQVKVPEFDMGAFGF